MTAPDNPGRAVPEHVNVLPELTFDMFDGQAVPSTLGRMEAPVNVLPAMTFDARGAALTPRLQLTLQFRQGATAFEVARDLHQLYAAVNRMEVNDGGSGLLPAESKTAAPGQGKLQVTFRPAKLENASERLNSLAVAINEALRTQSREIRSPDSILACEAQLVWMAA